MTDVHLLFASFVLSACTIQFGACHEVINAKARADGLHQYWRPFYAAWLSFAAGWLIIFNYAAVLGMDNNAKPGVVAIVLVMVRHVERLWLTKLLTSGQIANLECIWLE